MLQVKYFMLCIHCGSCCNITAVTSR